MESALNGESKEAKKVINNDPLSPISPICLSFQNNNYKLKFKKM